LTLTHSYDEVWWAWHQESLSTRTIDYLQIDLSRTRKGLL
jgi:D-alanyl-lipoteichoic acid acyltransferase DltB (MBOAT superfamily)